MWHHWYMNSNFYVVICTVIPVLLLSFTFTTFARTGTIRNKIDLWSTRVALFGNILLGLAGAASVILAAIALQCNSGMPGWINVLMLVSVIGLLAVNLTSVITSAIFLLCDLKVGDSFGESRH